MSEINNDVFMALVKTILEKLGDKVSTEEAAQLAAGTMAMSAMKRKLQEKCKGVDKEADCSTTVGMVMNSPWESEGKAATFLMACCFCGIGEEQAEEIARIIGISKYTFGSLLGALVQEGALLAVEGNMVKIVDEDAEEVVPAVEASESVH